jgi:hypothetical protein
MSVSTLTTAPQKQAGTPLVQYRLFKGLPHGTKGKFWNAVAINLNSVAWSFLFPAAAVADTCETNWTRMLATRVLHFNKQAKRRSNLRKLEMLGLVRQVEMTVNGNRGQVIATMKKEQRHPLLRTWKETASSAPKQSKRRSTHFWMHT